jgi:hypothetical protein
MSASETESTNDNSNSNQTIKDALKIARLLRKHLSSTEDCPHCRELFSEAFD